MTADVGGTNEIGEATNTLTHNTLTHTPHTNQPTTQPPTDSYVRFIVDTMACYVLRDGCAFEQTIMEREAANPAFAFLFDLQCAEHAYYRWRLWSLACGDSLRSWRVEPFVMVAPGPSWVPPAMTSVADSKKRALVRGDVCWYCYR